MQTLRRALSSPVVHLCLLTGLLAFVFARTNIIPQDDHFNYQRFIEALAGGKLDLSIPGFHGASFLALPLYLLTRSPVANIWFQIFCALSLPALGYWAAKGIFQDKVQGIFFSYALALMPFLTFIAFRGFTFPSYTLFLLLTLGLRVRGSAWTFLPLGISILIKPFSIALFPLFFLWEPALRQPMLRRGWVQYLLALILPALYVAIEYSQIGRIIIGAHPNLDQSNVFMWQRLPLNMLHGIQMIFSVHNYYFPDPAKTGPGNLTHSSPFLLVLGCFSFLYPKLGWKQNRLAIVLGLSCAAAFLLSAMLDHMDHFYMETAVILLTLAAIPLLTTHRLLLPLALVTFHFQFFYLYLLWKDTYFMDRSLFLIPVVIDAVALAAWAFLLAPRVPWKSIVKWCSETHRA